MIRFPFESLWFVCVMFEELKLRMWLCIVFLMLLDAR